MGCCGLADGSPADRPGPDADVGIVARRRRERQFGDDQADPLAEVVDLDRFVEPLPDGSGIRPITSTSRKTKAIWNILSQNGLTSNVVGWFASHPAEPIRGAVVSDYFVHPPEKGADFSAVPAGVCHPERLAQ